MYKVKGYVFYHNDNGEIHKYPLDGIKANSYEEVFENLKLIHMDHYMFILKKVKE